MILNIIIKEKRWSNRIMEKKSILKELIILFWVFIIGSILGYIYEMILVLLQKGYFESRQGLIYGPFIPVYGIGGIVYYIILNNVKTKNKAKIFLITAVLGGTTEYLCSFVQEKVFGTISWDYSYLTFNLNGRTSLLHCTYWGIAGILYSLYISPKIEKLKENINKNSLRIITIVLTVFMIWDISISCLAAGRQYNRKNNIEPKNKLDVYLDEHYPDEVIDKIYANKKDVF